MFCCMRLLNFEVRGRCTSFQSQFQTQKARPLRILARNTLRNHQSGLPRHLRQHRLVLRQHLCRLVRCQFQQNPFRRVLLRQSRGPYRRHRIGCHYLPRRRQYHQAYLSPQRVVEGERPVLPRTKTTAIRRANKTSDTGQPIGPFAPTRLFHSPKLVGRKQAGHGRAPEVPLHAAWVKDLP